MMINLVYYSNKLLVLLLFRIVHSVSPIDKSIFVYVQKQLHKLRIFSVQYL